MTGGDFERAQTVKDLMKDLISAGDDETKQFAVVKKMQGLPHSSAMDIIQDAVFASHTEANTTGVLLNLEAQIHGDHIRMQVEHYSKDHFDPTLPSIFFDINPSPKRDTECKAIAAEEPSAIGKSIGQYVAKNDIISAATMLSCVPDAKLMQVLPEITVVGNSPNGDLAVGTRQLPTGNFLAITRDKVPVLTLVSSFEQQASNR